MRLTQWIKTMFGI
jgi:hypothetical protein